MPIAICKQNSPTFQDFIENVSQNIAPNKKFEFDFSAYSLKVKVSQNEALSLSIVKDGKILNKLENSNLGLVASLNILATEFQGLQLHQFQTSVKEVCQQSREMSRYFA